eukprot:31039-Pelagococcus_subviridis.AAC.4
MKSWTTLFASGFAGPRPILIEVLKDEVEHRLAVLLDVLDFQEPACAGGRRTRAADARAGGRGGELGGRERAGRERRRTV